VLKESLIFRNPKVLQEHLRNLRQTDPAVEVQFATDTGTPSGLEQFADRLTVPPGTNWAGSAEMETDGGFFGGSGLIV